MEIINSKRRDNNELETCKYLWEEFKYRHDLIWQRIFLLTTAVVILSIIPYVQRDIAVLLRYWIILAPILAVGLTIFSFVVFENELELFDRISKAYWRAQNHLLPRDLRHDPNKKAPFPRFVKAYIVFLGLLSIVNLGITLCIWIPRILSTFQTSYFW